MSAEKTPDFLALEERGCQNGSFITEDFFQAASSRDPDQILNLLEGGGADPNLQDSSGNTPLHLIFNLTCSCNICIRNCESCSAVLLNFSQVDVNVQNKNGETPLHLAALNQLENCAENLIFKGADCYIASKNGDVAMSLIASEIPTLFCKILDQSVSVSATHHRSLNCEVKIDFRPLILPSDKTCQERTDRDSQSEDTYCNEMRLLDSLLSADEDTKQKIFLHPVVGIFLNQKWRRRRFFLTVTVLSRLLWLLFFTNYIVYVYLIKCPCHNYSLYGAKNISEDTTANFSELILNNSNTDNEGKNLTDQQRNCLEASEVTFGFVLVLLLTFLRLGYNAVELCLSRRVNFRDVSHIIVMCMVIGSFYPTIARQTFIPGIQYQFAAVTVFVAWSMNLTLFGNFRKIGGYFEIYVQVLKRFLSIMPTFVFLYVAFALAFCVLFPKITFFSYFGFSFIRVLIMTMGTDYEALFYNNRFADDSFGPTVGHLLYAFFVVSVSILLLNLLIGLTVSDIQNLQKQAEMRQIMGEINYVHSMESMVYSKRMPSFIGKFLRKSLSLAAMLEKGSHNQTYFMFKINNPEDTTVPTELKNAAKALVEKVHNEKQALICEQKTNFVLDRTSQKIPNSNYSGSSFRNSASNINSV